MTATETLSERIFKLEIMALLVPDLGKDVLKVEDEMACLRGKLQTLRRKIRDGERAQRILAHLTEQHDRVVAGGELLAEHAAPPPSAIQADEDTVVDVQTADTDSHSTPTPNVNTLPIPAQSGPIPAQSDVGERLPDEALSDDFEYVGQRQRVLEYVQAAEPGQRITADDALTVLDMPRKAVQRYLGEAVAEGLLVRQDGTGSPRVPSVYHRMPVAAPAEPPQETRDAMAATEIAQGDDPDLDPADKASTALPRPSLKSRALEVMMRDRTRVWTPTVLAVEADAGEDEMRGALREMFESGVILRARPGAGARSAEYCMELPVAAAPSLAPVPPRLTTDEASLFDLLRREDDGMVQRVAQSRLNWSTPRTDKAVQGLTRAGHLGRSGDQLKVVPVALQGQPEAV